jgi:hypothetical protein
MTDRVLLFSRPSAPTARPLLGFGLALGLAFGLGGCADLGDGYLSGAFVDPAKYDLYDCKQLDTERKSLATQTASLQKLIDKAHTGVAGSVVGEVAYRNNYTVVRASAKLADQVWAQDKCDAASLPAAAAGAPARAGSAGAPVRSGGAIH